KLKSSKENSAVHEGSAQNESITNREGRTSEDLLEQTPAGRGAAERADLISRAAVVAWRP
ncbi:MAG: hypothetical protein KA978_31930, partial [Deltaproteobacteria bacterium]|nr:hypothetical protein [Deltaproteobacteria bacterium]